MNDPAPAHWTRRIFAPLCVLAIAIGVIPLSKLEAIKAAEHWTSDWRTAWFSTRKSSQDESVAVVLITEETLQDSPVRIPMDRHMIAKVIRAIASAQPAVIGIDFVFARPTEASADADLLSAIREAKVPIVLGSIDERMGLPPKQLDYYRQFLAAAQRPTGHLYFERRTNLIGISDHVVREMPEPVAGQPSFAEMLAQFKRKNAAPHTRPIAWLLPPRDGSDTFYEIEAQELLESAEDAEPLIAGLTGKVVLIGSDLNDMDRHLTPLSVVDEARLPGVMIHAQMVSQLIDDRWLRGTYLSEESSCSWSLPPGAT
jgi:adenylate cyclase